jgi:hypothetical protein
MRRINDKKPQENKRLCSRLQVSCERWIRTMVRFQLSNESLVAQTRRVGRKLLVLWFAGQGVVGPGVVDDFAQ